jgi:hypothetical protein
MENPELGPRAWLNKYVQHKKMVGKNTHQVQLGEKQCNCFTYQNDQIWELFSFKPQNGLIVRCSARL